MRTTRQLTARIIVATVISNIICNSIYAVMIPFIMNYTASEFSAFVVKIIVATVLITPLATTTVYFMYKPIAKVLKAMDVGREASRPEITKARLAFVNIPTFLFIVGAASYMLGLALNFASDLVRSVPIQPDNLISRFFTALTWGTLNGVVTFRMLNIFLIDAKLRMNIFELDSPVKGERRETSRGKLFLSGLVFFVYIITYSGVIYYNHSKHNQIQVRQTYQTLLEQSAGQTLTPEMITSQLTAIDKDIERSSSNGFVPVLAILSSILLMVGLLYFVIVQEFQTHIDNLKGQIGKFSQGEIDLTRRINIISFDDVGEMTAGINKLISFLANTFLAIKDNTAVVFNSSHTTEATVVRSKTEAENLALLMNEVDKNTSKQIAVIETAVNCFNSLAGRIDVSVKLISEQTLAVEQTGAAIKSMLAIFESVMRSAIESESLFKELARSIDEGNSEVKQSLEATNEINVASSQVSEIVRLIEDIAQRSNILAMNASIEAAHAGQYGRGFAVVANEIRGLAENTTKSIHQIEELVEQLKVKNARGVQVTEKLSDIFRVLFEGTALTGEKMSSIAEAAKAQSVAATSNIGQIDRLLDLTKRLNRDTSSLKDENKEIGNAVQMLNVTSETLAQYNGKLLTGIQSITTDFEQLNTIFRESFQGIAALEEKVSSFKMETHT